MSTRKPIRRLIRSRSNLYYALASRTAAAETVRLAETPGGRWRDTATVATLGILLAILAAAAWSAQTSPRVTRNGAFVSADVKSIGGRAYIPLADAARAMGLRVSQSGSAYRLVPAGAAGKLPGIAGRLGADVSSAAWSLRVLSAEKVASYSDRFGSATEPVERKRAEDMLIAVRCRLKNRTHATQEVYFDKGNAGNTALTDDQEHAYSPAAFDSRNSGYSTNRMLAGTAHEFALVFSVPSGTRMKELIYTVGTSDDDKRTDFRVMLQP